jgi:KDO2-lipid IV(A) lauroyltransferase
MLDFLLVVLLRDVVRYRIKVIRQNLQASFNYNSERELQSDINGYYYFLAKVIREILTKPTKKLFERKVDLIHSPQIDQWLSESKSVIVVSGHIGNWEWSGMYLGVKYPGQVCALYKKVKSTFINSWMLKRRSITVDHLIEIGNIGALLKLIREKPVLIMMISDQNPGSDQGIIWVPFLGRETAFINGPEKIATKYKLPVVYLRTTSTNYGGYEFAFEAITNGSEILEANEITRRYAALLEKNIKDQRTQWLWSHRRWKRNVSLDSSNELK